MYYLIISSYFILRNLRSHKTLEYKKRRKKLDNKAGSTSYLHNNIQYNIMYCDLCVEVGTNRVGVIGLSKI